MPTLDFGTPEEIDALLKKRREREAKEWWDEYDRKAAIYKQERERLQKIRSGEIKLGKLEF